MNLIEEISQLPVIDTHEHFCTETDYKNMSCGFFSLLFPYVYDDMRTAGMTPDEWSYFIDESKPFSQRYDAAEKYIAAVKYGDYYVSVKRVLKHYYGVENVSRETAEIVNSNVMKNNQNIPELLNDMNIKKVFTYIGYNNTEQFKDSMFMPVPTVSDILPRSHADIERLEKETGITILYLDHLIKAIDILFQKYANCDVKAIKFGQAYHRKLDFAPVDKVSTEEILRKISAAKYYGDYTNCRDRDIVISYDMAKPLDDYLTDYMLTLAEQYGFVAVFHVGIHAWGENYISACHSEHLNGIISRHRKCKFILLHMGVPFIDEAILLAKYYKNVYVNMTWLHIVSSDIAKDAVRKCIEMLPTTKVMAFGGDYFLPQQIYGHLAATRNNLAEIFSEYIKSGRMTQAEAINIIRMWLYNNPASILTIEQS